MKVQYRASHIWLYNASRVYRLQIMLNILFGVLDVAIGLTEVWLSKRLIDGATSGSTWHLADGGWLSLPALTTMLVACMLTSVALAYAVRWLRATLGIRSLNRMQAAEYGALLRAPWLYLRKQHSGTMTNTLTEDLSTISQFLSEQFPALVTAVLQFIGAFVFLCLMDWRLALVIVVVTPVLIVVAQVYIRMMRRYRHEVRTEQAGIQAYIQESLQHSLLFKAFGRGTYAQALLGERHARLETAYLRTTRYSALAMVLVRLAFSAGYLIAFVWGAHSLSAGLISFGVMIAFIQLVGQIQQPMRMLLSYVGTFVNVSTAVERVAAMQSPQKEVAPPAVTDSPDGSIRLNEVSFAYPDALEPVIDRYSLTVPSGTLAAVVGLTGIGKTTFVQLLLGLLPPEKGSIARPKGGFAYVPQGNTLLSGTIRDNLLIGNPEASDDQMTQALRLACADFALSDERGLDYPCGEKGVGLSEGQAQRVAIARALLIDAPVLVLDEAFSALDTPTARTILTNIRAARPAQTIICITHRDSLLEQAEQVVRFS